MEALHQNNFNILLQGKSKGRGKGVINSPLNNGSHCKTDYKDLDNFKITFDCNQRKIDLKKEDRSMKNDNSLSIHQLNKQTFQFEDFVPSCPVCDRQDSDILCKSCGAIWKVILCFIKIYLFSKHFNILRHFF